MFVDFFDRLMWAGSFFTPMSMNSDASMQGPALVIMAIISARLLMAQTGGEGMFIFALNFIAFIVAGYIGNMMLYDRLSVTFDPFVAIVMSGYALITVTGIILLLVNRKTT